MARLIDKDNLCCIGAVNAQLFVTDLLNWQEELSPTDWDDCVVYSTIDTIIDLLIDNMEV